MDHIDEIGPEDSDGTEKFLSPSDVVAILKP
jgi:hypothetical protein